ncbi:putative benzoate 4-monooxygenase cytochrome P450 [Dactylonectria macrodidyma]|uniref:Benzoate 4-monooxygenase cytochrome P450 n=1 Tax=Dactylonectria macrodidyma TaxID=307937 RepID=A0A9P9E3V7_9HYPO|nr:putative benzoate 4-monooxygenase cytochrome P450 [Dactylonectria macrodidyma]
MTSLLATLFDSNTVPYGTTLVSLLVGGMAFYVIYQRYFHPLASYPGPFWASLTDVWQVLQFLSLQQPYYLTELHERYGPFVRYGPDKLSITAEDAVSIIYQRGGKNMPKTEFYNAYNAYGTKNSNVFGMRDENMHSIRRRHMSHSFSMSYIKGIEQYLDENVKILCDKISGFAERKEVFDLKKVLHYYVIDVLGELAFSQSFGIQISDDESRIPPVVQHSLLGAVTGAWPAMTNTLRAWLPVVPHAGLQALFKARAACAKLAAECVQRRVKDLEGVENANGQRKDILTNLILATDPDTGERFTPTDLQAEAFGFIIAGTHTTSATTTLLLYHLLHAPEILAKCVSEIDSNLTPLDADQPAYSVTEAETSLPYLRQCVRENFRLTPVFTMPLARRVVAPEGVVIAGRHIKQGTSVAICNHAFHHNPEVWGEDHNVFRPGRWEAPEMAQRARLLMHFGLGGRQCLGKAVAQTNIYKLASTLLRHFEFQLADAEEREDVSSGKFHGLVPEMISVGISDLKHPLLVTAKVRE